MRGRFNKQLLWRWFTLMSRRDLAKIGGELGADESAYTKMAVDGKKDRLKAGKYAKEWKAGAVIV